MSRLTRPQRLGLLLTAILALLAVIGVALLPSPRADVPTYEAAVTDSVAVKSDSVKSSRKKSRQPKAQPAPQPTRSHRDETF